MFENIKRASFRHKNNKPWYYIKGYARLILSPQKNKKKLVRLLSNIPEEEKEYYNKRLEYYNKLTKDKPLPLETPRIKDVISAKKKTVYIFDFQEYARYFSPDLRIMPCFGDVTHIPSIPSIVKSRPIEGDNENSVVLKLVKIRHFLFIKDKNAFTDKKNILIGRGKVRQPHRIRFMKMYYKHPLCDVGQVNKTSEARFPAKRLTIAEHLHYKFILCLEGNDVASNLKWVMSSNSLAVMPKPKYETWFMEGTLIPNYHYVLIKDDYSDVEERMNYYINHTEEALQIIKNAHEYVDQFKNKKRERLLSLLVLNKYFERTNQRQSEE